ncbi:response regulator transcription factor [Kribbella lupini]|uniref:Response regulator transcription factor n=1 Tax=Kribbella lupini TaxID=291602 RepID=A0ABN2ABW5_9ACTN
MISLIIVDDHPIVRDGLRGIFDSDPAFDVVGEAGDGAEALTIAGRHRPDVVLLDLRMPGLSGAQLIRALRAQQPTVRILVLTTFDDDTEIHAAIDEGATGYLLKDTPRTELRRAVEATARGEHVLSPTVAHALTRRSTTPEHQKLSPRELEVLSLVARGTTNREIAARLFITEATVKTHLLHLYAKLEAKDRAAAVAIAYQRGLLSH